MARIRTVKPEFFRHEGIQDMAQRLGPHVMLVFSGIWCLADREGRFEWRPRQMKLDILPFLDFDMSAAMDALAEAKFLRKYSVGGNLYGQVESWSRHQIPGRDEPPSEIPAPDGSMTVYDRPPNQTQRVKIYDRDNYICRYCGRNLRNDARAICLDHVIPYAKGGTNREKNLVTSCKKCNASKGARTPEEAGLKWPDGLGETYDNPPLTPPSKKKKSQRHPVNPPLTPPVNPPSTGGTHPPDKEWVREGEWVRELELELEGEGERDFPAVLAEERTERQIRNGIWEGIREVTGFEPKTDGDKSRMGKVVKDLRAKGAHPEDVPARATRYRQAWPKMTLTPEALVKHWDVFAAETTTGLNGAQTNLDTLHRNMDVALAQMED
jgi:hypothetical protein